MEKETGELYAGDALYLFRYNVRDVKGLKEKRK